MIKCLEDRNLVKLVAYPELYQDVLRFNFLGCKKSDHQCDVVLAIAEAAFDDSFGFVGDEAASSEENRDIANILRDPVEDGLRLGSLVFPASRDLIGELLYGRRNACLGGGCLIKGLADTFIAVKC